MSLVLKHEINDTIELPFGDDAGNGDCFNPKQDDQAQASSGSSADRSGRKYVILGLSSAAAILFSFAISMAVVKNNGVISSSAAGATAAAPVLAKSSKSPVAKGSKGPKATKAKASKAGGEAPAPPSTPAPTTGAGGCGSDPSITYERFDTDGYCKDSQNAFYPTVRFGDMMGRYEGYVGLGETGCGELCALHVGGCQVTNGTFRGFSYQPYAHKPLPSMPQFERCWCFVDYGSTFAADADLESSDYVYLWKPTGPRYGGVDVIGTGVINHTESYTYDPDVTCSKAVYSN